jgi:hypothetical protein
MQDSVAVTIGSMLSACHVATCDGRALDLICNAGVSTTRAPEALFSDNLLNANSMGTMFQGHEKKGNMVRAAPLG